MRKTRDFGITTIGTCVIALAGCLAAPEGDDEEASVLDGQPVSVFDADEEAASPRVARLHQALAVAAARAAGDATDREVLALLDAADDYSEASLLARVAGGAFAGPVPGVPQGFIDELGPVANDLFVFESWNVVHSEAVSKRLAEIREARDARLDALTDQEFEEYAAEMKIKHEVLRRSLADALGRPFDARPTTAVIEAPDGSIWRRKQIGERPRTGELRHGLPGGGPLAEKERAQAQLGEPELMEYSPIDVVDFTARPTDPLGQLNGSDDRDLRSSENGFTLDGSVWGPKMLLTGLNDDADPPNGTSLNVRCSGVKISERIVTSVGHCFFKDGSYNVTRRLIPGADGIADSESNADPSPHGTTNSEYRYVRDNWFDHEWTNHDFGLMVLWGGSVFRCWPWHGWQENINGLTLDTVYIFGYPDEQLDCSGANSPRGDGKCWGSMYGDGGDVATEGGYRFHYYIDTQPGQSGSGVYKISGSSRTVYGNHRGEYGCCMNDASRLNGENTDLIQDAMSDNPADPC